jgi:hypothetical protein
MSIFWKKVEGYSLPYTNDSVLSTHKFTNVYRVLDRVSQYLIQSVIYNDVFSDREEDILIRTIVFKIFNRISTWEYIIDTYGEITYDNFRPEELSRLLTDLQKYTPIFSAAYMMTGSHSKYNHLPTKHHKWLHMVKNELIEANVFSKILNAHSLREIYNLLRKCSFMGPFIAFQYAIDINYSPVLAFDENSFVVAGIGALRGIKKCFKNIGENSNESIIKHIQSNFTVYQDRYNRRDFRPIPGREPKLIDLQNCFCETDKMLRIKMPHLSSGNKRIKQKYRPSSLSIDYTFPPSWEIKNIDSKTQWNSR